MHSLMHSRMHAHDRHFCICLCFVCAAPAERENHGQEDQHTGQERRLYRAKFKPIGASYVSGLVVKKIKLADGSAISTAGAPEADSIGISDDLIMKYDTMMVPVSQFEFTDAEIDDKFDGDHDYILKGYISSVTKNDIRIKFDGDTHVSSYPRQGSGQFVRRALQYHPRPALVVCFASLRDSRICTSLIYVISSARRQWPRP